MIYDTPTWAAQRLIRDPQLCKLLPGDQTEGHVEGYLRSLSAIDAYVKAPDLKVQQTAYDNGLAIHEASQSDSPGIAAKAELNAAFQGVLTTTLPNPPPRRVVHHVEPTEPTHHPSLPLFTWFGFFLAFTVSLYSILSVQAAGTQVPFHASLQPVAAWLSSHNLVGSNVATFLNWSIDKWLRTALSVFALFFLLPALWEFLEGKSERFMHNLWVFAACTAAIMSLTYTLADWNTTVGALCNWAIVSFAFYKFAHRFFLNRLSFRKRLFARWASVLLFVNRVCNSASEVMSKQNRSEPLPMRRLWKLLPKS